MLAGRCRLALQVVTGCLVRTAVVWFTFAPDRVHWAIRTERRAAKRGRRSAALLPGEHLAVLAAMMAVGAETP